jgi:hypothetical protein
MFSPEAQSAYSTLQSRALSASGGYMLSRLERALDEILRNPRNTSPAPFQVRSALANAGKVIENRRKLAPQDSLDEQAKSFDEPGKIDARYGVVEISYWLDRAAVSDADRGLLRCLAAGADATALAETAGVSVQRMRERVSRARRAASRDYQASVFAA